MEPNGQDAHAAGGSGLIDLQRVAQAPSLAPATRSIVHPGPQPQHPVIAGAEFVEPKSRTRGLVVGALFAVLGVGVAYGVLAQRGMGSSKAAAAKLEGTTVAAHMADDTADTARAAGAAVAKPAERASDKGVDPAALPAATALNTAPVQPAEMAADSKTVRSKITSRAAERSTVAAGTGQGARMIAADQAKAAEPARAAEPAPPVLPTRAAPEPTGLVGAIKKAAGPIDQSTPQAITTSAPAVVRGDIPDSPGQGAFAGAIGAQRGAARACVEDFDAPSRATIVFGSSGNVQSVSVSGPAAGTKAEGCIKAALSKASVGPFRRPTATATMTISP